MTEPGLKPLSALEALTIVLDDLHVIEAEDAQEIINLLKSLGYEIVRRDSDR